MTTINHSQTNDDTSSARDRASLRLRERSFLAWAVERGFYCLQKLSPASKLSSRKTDIYIISWIGFGLILAGISFCLWPTISGWLVCLLLIASILRIVDIIQVIGNVGIFDQLGSTGTKDQEQKVENILRSLVLLILNYFELMLWFGLIYVTLNLKNVCCFLDAFYFSVVTQLTIGYGDIQPLGPAKVVAGIQAILGWALTLLVLARFVSFLPKIHEVTANPSVDNSSNSTADSEKE